MPGSTILLTDAMFEDPAPTLANTEGHNVVVTSTAAGEGGPGPGSQTSITAMRQRLLSEAAVRFLRGDRAPLTLVVPHDWNPSDGSGAFFSGLDAGWLDLTSVQAVSRAATPTPVDGATLRYPKWQEAAELDQPNFDSADELIRSGVALQNLLTLNNIVSGTVTDQALGTVSYYARTRPIENRASADGSRVWIQNRLGRVHVEAPRAVTLSSSSGRFQATVSNELDQPVTVTIGARADDRLTIDSPASDRGPGQPPGRRTAHGAHQRERHPPGDPGRHRQARYAARRDHRPHHPVGPGQQCDLAVRRHRLRPALRGDRRPPVPAGPQRPAGAAATPGTAPGRPDGGPSRPTQKEPAGAATR